MTDHTPRAGHAGSVTVYMVGDGVETLREAIYSYGEARGDKSLVLLLFWQHISHHHLPQGSELCKCSRRKLAKVFVAASAPRSSVWQHRSCTDIGLPHFYT